MQFFVAKRAGLLHVPQDNGDLPLYILDGSMESGGADGDVFPPPIDHVAIELSTAAMENLIKDYFVEVLKEKPWAREAVNRLLRLARRLNQKTW